MHENFLASMGLKPLQPAKQGGPVKKRGPIYRYPNVKPCRQCEAEKKDCTRMLMKKQGTCDWCSPGACSLENTNKMKEEKKMSDMIGEGIPVKSNAKADKEHAEGVNGQEVNKEAKEQTEEEDDECDSLFVKERTSMDY